MNAMVELLAKFLFQSMMTTWLGAFLLPIAEWFARVVPFICSAGLPREERDRWREERRSHIYEERAGRQTLGYRPPEIALYLFIEVAKGLPGDVLCIVQSGHALFIHILRGDPEEPTSVVIARMKRQERGIKILATPAILSSMADIALSTWSLGWIWRVIGLIGIALSIMIPVSWWFVGRLERKLDE